MSRQRLQLIDVVEEVQRVDTDVKRLQRSIRAHEELADGKSRKVVNLSWHYALLVYKSKDVFACKVLAREWNELRYQLHRPNRANCSSECRKLILMLRESPKLLAQVLLWIESTKHSNNLIRDSLVCVCGGLLFADDQKVGLQLLQELLLNRISECDKAEDVFDSYTSVFHKAYMEYLNLSVSIHSFITGILYSPLVDLVTECIDYLDYDSSKVIARLNEKVSSPGGNQVIPLNKDGEENIRQKVNDSRQKLIQYCIKILTNFENNLTAMPPGLVWLLTAARHAILRKWPQVDETALCKSLLDLLFGTILCPAMINPDHRGLLDSCLLTRPVRHNINQIALLLQALPRLSFEELGNQVDSFHEMMASFDMSKFHQLSKRLAQLLSLNSFPCTVLLPIAKRPFLYITKQQLDNTVSAIMEMKDHSPVNTQFSELILLANQCSEETLNISVTTSPDATPTSTPSSTPPARRKRWQRPQSGTRSPNKEKSNTIALPIGGGASAAGKSKPLFLGEEKEQLVMISVPLTSDWNTKDVYTVEQEPERKFMKSLKGEKQIEENGHPLLLDLTANSVVNENKGVGLKSDVEIAATNNAHNGLSIDDDTLSHVQNCLSRALEGVSLDNMSQVFAVVNNPAVDHLISLEQSNKSCLKDELVAILHQQVNWYRCSGQDGEMLLLQDLLQKLDQIPTKKMSQLVAMVMEQCRQREKYVNYLRKLDQELCRHGSQMDSTLNLINKLLELVGTSVATFTVKHFLLEQEGMMKQFKSQVKKGEVIDDKCALVHKYLQQFQQKLLTRPLWGSALNEDCDDHMITEACHFIQHMCYSNIFRNVFYPNGVSDQSRDRIFQQHLGDLSTTWDLKQITKEYHVTSPWTSAQQHLKIMRCYMTPNGKVLCVLRCCNTIIHLLRCCHNGHPPGADEVFPVLLYVLIKANPGSLLSTIQFVDTFRLDELEGETAYWWHQFTTAVQYTKTLISSQQ